VADGTVLAYGLAVEEGRTDGDFTHFTWVAVKDLGSLEKIRSAFSADRDKRSQEEQDAITAEFLKTIEPDASRSEVGRSIMFKVGGMK